MNNANILIVDDERSAREGLKDLIAAWGYPTEIAGDGCEAIEKMESFLPQIVITDLMMPGLDGMVLLKQIKAINLSTSVIILTAQGSIESAVEAIKVGAYDYLTKPLDIVRLKNLIEKISQQLSIQKEVALLRYKLKHMGSFGDLIGNCQAMREVFHTIELAAPSSASVLISGESGTGKELIAREIHKHSHRSHKPFIAINCAAIPGTLLESEVFGHEKGAFTGAINRKEGCFEIADGGTLFLDELTEMSYDMQSKFLRVLEDGTFRRVGGEG